MFSYYLNPLHEKLTDCCRGCIIIWCGTGASPPVEEGVEDVATPAARLCIPCSRPGISAGFARFPAAACCNAAYKVIKRQKTLVIHAQCITNCEKPAKLIL